MQRTSFLGSGVDGGRKCLHLKLFLESWFQGCVTSRRDTRIKVCFLLLFFFGGVVSACPLLFFYSVLVSISVFVTLSTVVRSNNYPDNSLLSHSVLLVLFLPYWSFQLYISL